MFRWPQCWLQADLAPCALTLLRVRAGGGVPGVPGCGCAAQVATGDHPRQLLAAMIASLDWRRGLSDNLGREGHEVWLQGEPGGSWDVGGSGQTKAAMCFYSFPSNEFGMLRGFLYFNGAMRKSYLASGTRDSCFACFGSAGQAQLLESRPCQEICSNAGAVGAFLSLKGGSPFPLGVVSSRKGWVFEQGTASTKHATTLWGCGQKLGHSFGRF